MSNSDITACKIRPSARLLHTIGRDLVKDHFAALVELVKNSYDADSPDAIIHLKYDETASLLNITISDHGHGMDRDTVVNKWLVPATSDKLSRRTSPNGRPLQGRKGIGRFAAAVLGDRVSLETKVDRQPRIGLSLNFAEFTGDKYLEDIDISLTETKTEEPQGTLISISQDEVDLERLNQLWGENNRHKLLIELRKLLAPVEILKQANSLGYNQKRDPFDIYIRYEGFPSIEDEIAPVKPFNLIDLYDYRIWGSIDENGKAILKFSNQNLPSLPPEEITKRFFIDKPSEQAAPGNIKIDFRVFDRDPDSIEELINRGLQDPLTGEPVGRRKAREILDEYYGVSMYRGQFRIRPYGDQDVDWLELDKKRVQKPSIRVGHNQIIGFVSIEAEEKSNLEEKSARDGLVENRYYAGLKLFLSAALNEIETRRLSYREKSYRGRKVSNIYDAVDDLFDMEPIKTRIDDKIKSLTLDQKDKDSLVDLFSNELQAESIRKTQELNKIKEIIALYQGQATLGKVTHVMLHEGRKHIKVLNEYPPRIVKWIDKLLTEYDQDLRDKLENRATAVSNNAKSLAYLFKKIEPLAVSRRPQPKELNLRKEILSCSDIFESEITSQKIKLTIDIPSDFTFFTTSFDINTIFANLLENSLYWLGVSDQASKEISISYASSQQGDEVWFEDNGPGFQGSNLENMFEPGFSMKPNGTGLGLALAGEAVQRMGGTIQAIDSDKGASFLIIFKGNKNG